MLGPNGENLPSSVLFACTMNAVRSPMAAGLMRHLYGHFTYVESIGVHPGEPDSFAIAVMDEIGLDISNHCPRDFSHLDDTSFDLVISLSPEAHHRALELTRASAIEAVYWPTFDPTGTTGSRAQILEAYRNVRDGLLERIKTYFLP
ncbi:MAG: low molecular weight phosphatase family protein [Alphaproteobacteria bacterium]|nr:MAG: low molecular weight phosphatase family protein [Alphaproteobacteria bacterium]